VQHLEQNSIREYKI